MDRKPYFILFWWLKVIFDTSELFQMSKYGIVRKKNKNKSLAPFWRFDRSDFKLQNIPPREKLYIWKSLILYCSDDQSDFWHFQAISNGQVWHSKKKASLQLHFEGLTDLTSNCKTYHLEELYRQKALFYTVLMVKSDFWHFQAISNDQIWYSKKKKSKSLAPFWRFDRSDFNLQNIPPGKVIWKKALFYTVLIIKSDFWHFQALSNGQIWHSKKKQVSSSILKA